MTAVHSDQSIADYDSFDYDYRTFWRGRDYEQWAETAALASAVRHLPRVTWCADFGGGYGRNFAHCRAIARHTVLVDYSRNNLSIAADVHAEAVADGSLHLVRADLAALPFRDAAFDASLTIRVLHHLRDADPACAEMLRTVSGAAIIDVPIKNHVLARARALVSGGSAALHDAAPRRVGTTDHPFTEFQLAAVRANVHRHGFDTELVASVNNLRRWDQRLPAAAVRTLTPPAHAAERLLQRVGRGWWGPNQFVLATRRQAVALRPAPGTLTGSLAARTCCPGCAGALRWTADAAGCPTCRCDYPRVDGYWDFTRSC